jgi:hypothetical protein
MDGLKQFMPLFNQAVSWLKYLSYIWLAFCLGVLAPFTYTSPYSPHQEMPAFHIVLFERPVNPAVILGQANPAVSQLFYRFTSQAAVISAQTPALTLAHFFLLDLSHGYLLPPVHDLLPLLFLAWFLLTLQTNGASAWLLPPEKPPRLQPT